MINKYNSEWKKIANDLITVPGAFLHLVTEDKAPPYGSTKWPYAQDLIMLVEASDSSTDEYLSRRMNVQKDAVSQLLDSVNNSRNGPCDVAHWLPPDNELCTAFLNALKDKGALFLLDPSKTDRFTIGRGFNQTIILSEPLISNRHLTVSWTPREIKAFCGRLLRRISDHTPDEDTFPFMELSEFGLRDAAGNLFDEPILTVTDSSLNGTYINQNNGETKKVNRDETKKFCVKDTISAGVPLIENGVYTFIAKFSVSIVSRHSPIVNFLNMMNHLKGCLVKTEPGSSRTPSPMIKANSVSSNSRSSSGVGSRTSTDVGGVGGPRRLTMMSQHISPRGRGLISEPYNLMKTPGKHVSPSLTSSTTSDGLSEDKNSRRHDDNIGGKVNHQSNSLEVVRMKNQISRNEKELERLNKELKNAIGGLDNMEAECRNWQVRAEESEQILREMVEVKELLETTRKDLNLATGQRLKLESENRSLKEKYESATSERDSMRNELIDVQQENEEFRFKLTENEQTIRHLEGTLQHISEEHEQLTESFVDFRGSVQYINDNFQSEIMNLLNRNNRKDQPRSNGFNLNQAFTNLNISQQTERANSQKLDDVEFEDDNPMTTTRHMRHRHNENNQSHRIISRDISEESKETLPPEPNHFEEALTPPLDRSTTIDDHNLIENDTNFDNVDPYEPLIENDTSYDNVGPYQPTLEDTPIATSSKDADDEQHLIFDPPIIKDQPTIIKTDRSPNQTGILSTDNEVLEDTCEQDNTPGKIVSTINGRMCEDDLMDIDESSQNRE